MQGVPINFLHIVVGRDAFPGITDRTLFYNTDSELQQAPWARISKLTSMGGGFRALGRGLHPEAAATPEAGFPKCHISLGFGVYGSRIWKLPRFKRRPHSHSPLGFMRTLLVVVIVVDAILDSSQGKQPHEEEGS